MPKSANKIVKHLPMLRRHADDRLNGGRMAASA